MFERCCHFEFIWIRIKHVSSIAERRDFITPVRLYFSVICGTVYAIEMSVEYSYSKTGQILQGDDGDFQVEIVDWHKNNGSKAAVLKTMQGTILERRRGGFVNESVGTHAFRALARAHPEWGLVVPRTYAEGDTW